MALNIREEEAYLNKLASEKYKEALLKRDKEKLILSWNSWPGREGYQEKNSTECYQELKGNDLDLYAVHYEAIEDLILSSQTGKYITLPEG